MIRISGGEYRSRPLASPPDETTSRPYARRAREAVFDLLRGWSEDARVLDLFSGIGTMGLEAVSRGAREVVLVERDRQIHRLLEENIETLGCGDRARAIHGDAYAETTLLRAPHPCELVFIDPPYAQVRDEETRPRVLDLVARCASVVARPGFLVLRTPIEPRDADFDVAGLDGPEVHGYGVGMWVLLYAPPAETSP